MAAFCPLLLVFLAIGLQLHGASSWRFGPWSEPVVIVEDDAINLSKFSIMCQADVPLVKCQFKVEPTEYDFDYPIIDFSHGLSSAVMTTDILMSMSRLMDIRYNGTGLEHGQCGATFRAAGIGKYEPNFNFGCRGADKAGEWHEMEFPGVNHLPSDFPASINPRVAVVKPGDDVTFLLKADANITNCDVNRTHLFIEHGDTQIYRIHENDRYYGTRPSEGECGLTVKNVTEADNGPLVLRGFTTGKWKETRRTSTLIVAVKPEHTYFDFEWWEYSVGETLNATCHCQPARPVANLTWTLDGKVIRQDAIDDDFQEDVWRWSWEMKDIVQRVSIKLEKEHFGKKLECIVQHLAMPKNEVYSDVINSEWSRGISWQVIAIFILIIIVILSPLLSLKNYYYACFMYLKSIF